MAPLDGRARDKIRADAMLQLRQPGVTTKLLLPVINYADLSFRENQFTKGIDNEHVFGVTPTFSQGLGKDNLVRFWIPYLEGTSAQTGAKELYWSVPATAMAILGGATGKLDTLKQELLAGRTEAFTLPGPRGGQNTALTLYPERYNKSRPHMVTPALHIVTELVLIVLTSLVFASFKPRMANILLLLLFNVCWILDFIYFYFSNEFINLNFSFMGIVIYKYLRQMETVFGALGKMKKKADT
jgi:hypothetical protein